MNGQPPAADAPFGVYCHIPFCTHRCDYCAFATWTDRSHLAEEYMAACRLQARRLAAEMAPVTSVFFGGGTPNLVAPQLLGDVLAELPLAADAEVTVECNPELVNLAQMGAYQAMGVNRISLGVQSLAPHVLASLGRRHDVSSVAPAVTAARRAGIAHLNLDLIYGAAGESARDWNGTLERAISLAPDHLSVYGLTVEPGTPLADEVARHPSRDPDPDEMADRYIAADELLAAAGYENYEISNWALGGARCGHNLLYWQQGNYAGIGCAAHSHRDGRRYWSVRTPERFIEAIAAGRDPTAGSEVLDAETRRAEALQLGVRTSDGIDAAVVPDDVAELFVPAGSGRMRLTARGRLLANEVAVRLTP